MPDQQEISEQQALLATHRRTLAHYLSQQAMLGIAYAPPGVTHGIYEARDAIRHIKARLRDWAAPVEDHPDDESPALGAGATAGEQVGAGLTALLDLMNAPDVRADVALFQDAFETVCKQIDLLGSYKELHDLLHELQFNCYGPIVRGARRFPDDEFFRESLTDYELELQQIITSLWAMIDRANLPTNERAWIQQVDQADVWLRAAIAEADHEQLDRAIAQLGRVLYIHPTRINERLKEAARDLPLPSLIQAMTAVQNRSLGGGLDPAKLHQLGQAVAMLRQISAELTQLIGEHDIWQEVDLELRQIEDHLDQNIKQLQWFWPDLQAKTAPLCGDAGNRWAQEFQRASAQLERALVAQETAAIIANFRSSRSRAGLCFFQADKKLKELCGALRHIDGPLASVMRMIA